MRHSKFCGKTSPILRVCCTWPREMIASFSTLLSFQRRTNSGSKKMIEIVLSIIRSVFVCAANDRGYVQNRDERFRLLGSQTHWDVFVRMHG